MAASLTILCHILGLFLFCLVLPHFLYLVYSMAPYFVWVWSSFLCKFHQHRQVSLPNDLYLCMVSSEASGHNCLNLILGLFFILLRFSCFLVCDQKKNWKNITPFLIQFSSHCGEISIHTVCFFFF